MSYQMIPLRVVILEPVFDLVLGGKPFEEIQNKPLLRVADVIFGVEKLLI